MPDQSEELQSQSVPAWAQLPLTILCILGGLLALSCFLLFLLAGFTAKPKADGSVIVDDEANLLAPETEAAIQEIRFPQGIPGVVRTVKSIPAPKIGAFATDLMSKEPHWQTLRPRGWLRRYFKQDPPFAPGVYVLVSLEPQLLQIRFGRKVRLGAYHQMLAVGTWYRDRQRFELAGLDQHVLETVREVAQRSEKLAAPRWPLSWAQYLASSVSSEFEDWLAPSDGLYSHLVLKNYIMLAHKVGATGAAWRFVAFSVAIFVFLWLVVKKLLIVGLLLPHTKRRWLCALLAALCNLGLFGALVTGFAALAVLSKGRVEDELALDALGLSFLSTTGFSVALFSTRGGLLLALPGAIVSFIGELAETAQHQQATGEARITFGWLGWGCALFLLPKAIAITLLVVLIWNAGRRIIGSIAEEEAAQPESGQVDSDG